MSPPVALTKDVNLGLALASGASTAEAAEIAHVSQRTVQRRLADPAFRKLLADMREQFISRALGRMAEKMTAAADQLASLLETDKPALRLRSARAIISLGLRLHESVYVTERIRELELELAQKQAAAS